MKRIFVYRDEVFHNQDPIFYIFSYIKQHSNIKFILNSTIMSYLMKRVTNI